MTQKYKIRTIICKGCGVSVTKRMPAGRGYCSLECYRQSARPQTKTGKNIRCEICNKEFYIPKARVEANARFCSVECTNEWQRRNKTKHTCKVCGKVFEWSPSRSKSGNYNITYCSLDCRDKDPSRAQMLIKMNYIQQTMKRSSIEVIGYNLLDKLGVEYTPQQIIADKFCVDAFVPAANLIIQFDGDYWHGHPNKFPNPDKRQLSRMCIDKSQNAYFKKCGYKVLRFWGSDLRNNIDKVQSSILAFSKLSPQ